MTIDPPLPEAKSFVNVDRLTNRVDPKRTEMEPPDDA
jgi:hypothetical protein